MKPSGPLAVLSLIVGVIGFVLLWNVDGRIATGVYIAFLADILWDVAMRLKQRGR